MASEAHVGNGTKQTYRYALHEGVIGQVRSPAIPWPKLTEPLERPITLRFQAAINLAPLYRKSTVVLVYTVRFGLFVESGPSNRP